MRLMKKELLLEQCRTLYHERFTSEILHRDFDVKGGEWTAENGYLIGKNRENNPGMILLKESFSGNVMLDFKASTILPCTHDINVMWNGSWDETTNTRGVAYVAGLQGWWQGKVGFEKSPDYRLNAGTPLFPFIPGKEYHIQTGSIDGHVFIIVDGSLLLEVTDPEPIDSSRYGKIGFEAYCSQIQIQDFYVKQIAYQPIEEQYIPEF